MISSIDDFSVLPENTKKQFFSICSDNEIASSFYFADKQTVSNMKNYLSPARLRKIRNNLKNTENSDSLEIDYSIFLIKVQNFLRDLT